MWGVLAFSFYQRRLRLRSLLPLLLFPAMISSTQLNGQQDILVYLGEDRIVGEDEPVLLTATVDLPGLGMLSPSAMSEGLTFTWFKRGFDEPEYPTEPFATSTTSNLIVEITDEPPGESTYYKVVVSDAIGIGCEDEVLVVKAKLLKVLFVNSNVLYKDPDNAATQTPFVVNIPTIGEEWHWDDDASPESKPIWFTKGAPMEVSLLVQLKGLNSSQELAINNVRIKAAVSADGFSTALPDETLISAINMSSVSGNTYQFSGIQAAIAFENINVFDQMTFSWVIAESATNSVWKNLKVHQHTVYVSNQPLPPITHPNDPLQQPLQYYFQSVVDLSCRAANGLEDAQAIVNNIYKLFTSQNVKKVGSSTGMKYWGNVSIGSFNTQELLYNDDGRCGAWSRFFVDMLSAQGIASTLVSIKHTPTLEDLNSLQNAASNFSGPNGVVIFNTSTNLADGAFLVKEWSITINNFYKRVVAEPEDYKNYALPITPTSVNAASTGTPAQSNSNPRSRFIDHNLVVYNGYYYDPSYGSYEGSSPYNAENPPFANFAAWGDRSISGSALMFNYFSNEFLWIKNTNQPAITDLNEVQQTYY